MDENYKKLKLTKSASKEDICAAYKKLSHKKHPDRGGSIDEFKEILDAFAELNNNSHKSKSNIFIKYYNKNDNKNSNKNDNKKIKCPNIVEILDVSLEQLYNRERIVKQVSVNIICNHCHGIGITEKVKMCTNCKTFNIKNNSDSNSNSDSINNICNVCECKDQIIRKECVCSKCKGSKVIKRSIKFTFNLNPKMRQDKQIIYLNKGNEFPHCERGNILFIVNEQFHQIFTRVNDNNLYMKYKINLVEALSGFTFYFQHLDGRKIYTDMNCVVNSGFRRILNEGMIKNKSDLIVEFIVELPRYTINILEQLELEKITLMKKRKIDIDFNEYNGCYILPTYNPFKNDK
jgi:DnaJ family protein A protein 2